MFDDYQIPVFLLIAALLPVLGYVNRRSPSVRTRLWMLAMVCVELQTLLLVFTPRLLAQVDAKALPTITFALNAGAEAALLISAVLFLAALSPIHFSLGGRQTHYAWLYLPPQLLYVGLYFGVSAHPSGPLLALFLLLALWTAAAAMAWSMQKGAVPIWLATAVVAFMIFLSVPFYLHGNVYWPLIMLLTGNLAMTALLVLYTYRRLSPGTIFTALGFLGWGLPSLLLIRPTVWTAFNPQMLAHAEALARLVLALGLAALVLEEELAGNSLASKRAQRIQTQLQKYTRHLFTARNLEQFDSTSSQLCAMLVEESCFSRAAIVVRLASGSFTLIGYAGMDGATASALDAMAQRMTAERLVTYGVPITADANAVEFDLKPWLLPGDDLERLHLTRICVVPMYGADSSIEGALLLAGARIALETMKADDLLPLEVFAGRVQIARAQSTMLGKLIDSERFAGLGQLASNVAQQLNNPLTVILGYSSLLEETSPAGLERRGAEAISSEATRMKGILERLARFSKLGAERFHSFSISDLVGDVELLLRTDFLRNSIEFRTAVEPGLPEIFGDAHQIRQALLHMVQFAVETVQRVGHNQPRSIRIEATLIDGMARIILTHSGARFPYPDRVFDSFSTGFSGSEATGLGLSLCAAIVRDHRGSIQAVNHDPTGSTIVIDLPVS